MCCPASTRLYAAAKDEILEQLAEMHLEAILAEAEEAVLNRDVPDTTVIEDDELNRSGFSDVHFTTTTSNDLPDFSPVTSTPIVVQPGDSIGPIIRTPSQTSLAASISHNTTEVALASNTNTVANEDDMGVIEDDEYTRWKMDFLSRPAEYGGPEIEDYEQWRDQHLGVEKAAVILFVLVVVMKALSSGEESPEGPSRVVIYEDGLGLTGQLRLYQGSERLNRQAMFDDALSLTRQLRLWGN